MSRMFFDVLEVNIVLSGVILVLCLLAGKLRKSYGAAWMKWVWVLLAVRFLVPYNFSVPFTEIRLLDMPGFEQEEIEFTDIAQTQEELQNEGEWIGENPIGMWQIADNADKEYSSVEIDKQSKMDSENAADDENVQNATEVDRIEKAEVIDQNEEVAKVEAVKEIKFSYSEILTGIWKFGMILGLFYFVFSYGAFCLKYRRNLEAVADKKLEQILGELQRKTMGNVLPVYQSRCVSSPMLVGILTPKLVIPILGEGWNNNELEMIVKHELCHYKKKDLWLKLLMVPVCCLNWFNPLVYVMKSQLFYDMELACDEAVLWGCNGDEREVYARVMLVFAGRTNQTVIISTTFGGNKKRMKQRIDYMLDEGQKKKGKFCMAVMGVAVATMTVFVSCGHKPYETEKMQSIEQVVGNAPAENMDSLKVDNEQKDNVQEERPQSFDYNHEYNEMLRICEGKVYLAGADGIYLLKRGTEKELVYENAYKFRRGMEIYQNYLFFCGSVMKENKETATIYRMDLNTYEVEDALVDLNQVYNCLYNISIYEDNLYVVSEFETQRIGFELDQNGRIIQQLDKYDNDFLYKEHNEYVYLESNMRKTLYDSEEYWKIVAELEKQYYPVLDVASCKKMLQGRQVVKKYRDEMYSSLYLENADGTYEFLCDTRYSFPLLITDTGVYYRYMSNDIEYIDYQTKTSSSIYTIEGTDEAILINYDADYVYMLVEHNTGEEVNGFWAEETRLVRVLREGGKAETVYRFEGDLREYGSLTRCAVYDNIMYFEMHDPIELKVKLMEGDEQLKIIGEVEETEDRKKIYEVAKKVTEAYFQGDIETIKKNLIEDYEWTIDTYLDTGNAYGAGSVTIYGVKGLSGVEDKIGERCTVEVEFLPAEDDSLLYFYMTFEKQESGWRISGYGLEK